MDTRSEETQAFTQKHFKIKMEKMVLDYVCTKRKKPYRLYDGEKGFRLTQVKKLFRNHHRWNVMFIDPYLVFQDHAIIQRRDQDKRNMLIHLIDEFLVHPKNIYEIRIAQKRMDRALCLLPNVYRRNDIARYAMRFFHYVDWLSDDFELMSNEYMHDRLVDIPDMEFSEKTDILSVKTSIYNMQQQIEGFELKISVVDNFNVEMASLYYGIVIRIPITLKAKANHRAWVTCLFQHALAYSSTKEVEKAVRNGFDIFSALERQGLTLEQCAKSWIPNEKNRKRFINRMKKLHF